MFLPGFVPFYIMQKEVITFCTERLKNWPSSRHAKNLTTGRTKDDCFSSSKSFWYSKPCMAVLIKSLLVICSSKFCYCQVKITTPLSGWKICQFVTYDEVLLMSSIQLLCWVASAANRFCRPVLWWPSFTEFSGPKPTQEAIVGPINTTHISNRHYTVEKTITHV